MRHEFRDESHTYFIFVIYGGRFHPLQSIIDGFAALRSEREELRTRYGV